jgi:hypothetical protein
MDILLQLFLRFGLLAGGFLMVSLILRVRTNSFINKSHKAVGVVIKLKKVPFENWETFSPVVRFETSDGRALSFTDPVSKYPAEFEVGERAQVLYNPQDPHKARAVKRISDLFLAAKLFGGAGAVLLAIGLLVGLIFGLTNNLPSSF